MLKKLRQLYAGQWTDAFDCSTMPRTYLNSIGLKKSKLIYTPHHASHAAAGYYTSPFEDSAIVVLDAIGEFECASIWKGTGDEIKKVWSRNYPNSLGLFYSAFTKLIGYKPIVEEHLLQRDSDLGDPHRYYYQIKDYFDGIVSLKYNFHRGVGPWSEIENDQDRYDIAAAVQRIFEEQVDMVMVTAQHLTNSKNLVYMGGCSMNSKYNKRLNQRWDRLWSLPQPGDPSSSIGAVLYHKKYRVKWPGPLAKHMEIKV
jgi:carbamoyltransferase